MAKICEEHDTVVGPDPGEDNQLTYTLAVINETFRLFPDVSSPRKEAQVFILTHSERWSFSTDHCLVRALHHGVHHNPALWPKVEGFLPERFLGGQGVAEALNSTKSGAWRPFDYGLRLCIDIELALTGPKVFLAITIRGFDLEQAFEE